MLKLSSNCAVALRFQLPIASEQITQFLSIIRIKFVSWCLLILSIFEAIFMNSDCYFCKICVFLLYKFNSINWERHWSKLINQYLFIIRIKFRPICFLINRWSKIYKFGPSFLQNLCISIIQIQLVLLLFYKLGTLSKQTD